MHINNPLVSVIVPSYNHEKYILQTIESIVNQTYENIELIVIDDGSKDDSVSILKNLEKEYNFTLITRENKGLCETLNEGISIANGKYIAVCASDDIYLENKIKTQVDFMENNSDFALCYSKVISFNNDGEKKYTKSDKCKSGYIFYDLLKTNFIPAVTQMYKKDIFDIIGNFDKTLWIEDWDMLLRISYKYQIGFIDEYLAMYRNHDTNISGSKYSDKMYKNEKAILEKWSEIKEYEKFVSFWAVKWFCNLQEFDKVESKKYLKFALKKFYIKKVFKALIKYYLR